MAERIAILGGGLMGHGIAQVFACAGHGVRITDPVAEVRSGILARIKANLGNLRHDNGPLARIEIVDTLQACVAGADLVI